jgi:hypothetical protein
MPIPYERLIVWLAGPISILAGWVATALVTRVGILGDLGLGHDQIAHGIVTAVTFTVGAALTYAAHHKWLTNLPKWWDLSGLTVPAAAADEPDLSSTRDTVGLDAGPGIAAAEVVAAGAPDLPDAQGIALTPPPPADPATP